MSSKNPEMLWVSRELAEALPLVRPFEPAAVWDNEKKKFLDVQQQEDGLPVWESQALLTLGWGRQVTSVRIRILSKSDPGITPDPMRLLTLMSGQEVES